MSSFTRLTKPAGSSSVPPSASTACSRSTCAQSEKRLSSYLSLKYEDKTSFVGKMFEGKMQEGIFNFANGDVYKGSFCDNTLSGQGTFTYHKNSRFVEYIGSFSKGQMHGAGEMTMTDGSKFEGIFIEGSQRGGIGTLEIKNQKVYTRLVGEFTKFALNGQGEYFNYKTGDYYKGPFLNSMFQTDPDQTEQGALYFGVIDRSTRKPDLTGPNIKWFKGEFIFGRFKGKGTIHYDDRFEYIGAAVDGMRHGKGELHDKQTGDKYEGDWIKDALQNKSQLTYGSDSLKVWYKGDFENIKEPACNLLPRPRGSGCLKLNDGTEYIGEMYKGMREGSGKLLKSTTPGTPAVVIYDGLFMADKICMR